MKALIAIGMVGLAALSVPAGHAQTVFLSKYAGQPQTITNIRIAAASVLPDKWNKEVNWRRIETLVRHAAMESGARVVVTPEGCLEGYVINEVNSEKDPGKKEALLSNFLALGEPIDGAYMKKASALCKELGVFLVLGFLEREKDILHNSAALFDPDGEIIGKYSKTHFAQGYAVNPDYYKAGDDYPVFDTPFGKVGILICYDRQNPEPARILALRGAQVLFVPSYGNYTDEYGWNTILMRTRAYENRYPVVFCHPFQSLLIERSGELRALGRSDEVVCYDVDTSPDRYKDRFVNRRPATYRPLLEGSDPAEKK
ncbi:MAG TPA: carbon-nitrogen hydrolase family protein [bacterium]|nr:carbon-nitrogen hydrolase family protein [bacterium]HQL60712.1 carbon-nitrogen hydrolase family protein [bacterium]